MIWDLLAGVVILAVLALFLRAGFVKHTVPAGHSGLLYRNEVFAEALEPGVYRRFDPLRSEQLVVIATVATALSPNVFEVISKDQFSFRVMVTPLVTIANAREFHEGTPPISKDMAQFYTGPEMRLSLLNPVLSNGIMEAVAAKTLEEFLDDPAGALEGVSTEVAKVLPGVQLDNLLLTSITLPPEVRKMFTEVERARREGLAGLERARAEQASLRALANAARNLADNPQLAQLRMLQTMETAKGAKTFVLGSPPESVPGAEKPQG
ncbi:SPFH domain-containing protein [Altererythrobacter lutimaris]|uniref:Band 7 domain-containing protein n=1 Tax=Altererythrobacter lutimaris TaxID=2743979 RepID=A0A850HJ04_9SPHN|nr:SPFH domain-containing protein [Altererythrobacter lutimaris]NVE95922.1 hypothetical protein [Altererythrobacter lutimaris]